MVEILGLEGCEKTLRIFPFCEMEIGSGEKMEKINPLWLALVTGAIAILSSISSLWFGSSLSREAEDRKWRRDHCLEIYTEVLKVCETVHLESLIAYNADANSEEQEKHGRLAFEATVELHHLVDSVLLLSPKEMYDDIKNLTSHCSLLGTKSLERPKIPRAEWDKLYGPDYSMVYVDFTAAARNDLRIHKPHFTAEEWAKRTKEWKREKTK